MDDEAKRMEPKSARESSKRVEGWQPRNCARTLTVIACRLFSTRFEIRTSYLVLARVT